MPLSRIALHGVLPMSFKSINFYSDSRMPAESDRNRRGDRTHLGSRNAESLSKRLAYLNNTDYRMWIDDAVAQQKLSSHWIV